MGIWELGLCGVEEYRTSAPILLAWYCHGITSGVSCAAHLSAHQFWGPLVPVPAAPLGLSAVVPAHPGAWKHPGVHLDPSGFHCLRAHHHPSNHPCQPATIPLPAHPSPPPSFSALSPQLGQSWWPSRPWCWPWHPMDTMPHVPVPSLERGHRPGSPSAPSIIDHRSGVHAKAVPAAKALCPQPPQSTRTTSPSSITFILQTTM